MTFKRAVRTLKIKYLGDNFDIIEAKKIAIGAIEKQIPKSVVLRDNATLSCPCCGNNIGIVKCNYCIDCGQKLDWGKLHYEK